MANLWITITTSWRLVDVQAYLSVVISAISTLMILVFAAACWRLNASRIFVYNGVTLSSLFSVGNVGDVCDVAWLLKTGMLQKKHITLVMRCFVVVLFAAANLASGPIARFSTRRSTVIEQREVNGTLSLKGNNCLNNMDVDWSSRLADLDRAGYPLDQLLDFAPNITSKWIYSPEQWNSSFTTKCDFTNETKVDLEATGNYGTFYTEIPGLFDLIPERFRDQYYSEETQLSGNRWTNGNDTWIWKDTMLTIVRTLADQDFTFDKGGTFGSITMIAVHLHKAPWTPDYNLGNFGKGKIPESSYIRATCDVISAKRNPDDWNRAYPDTTWDGSCFAESILQHYMGNFSRLSMSDQPISLPSAENLVRFWQAYTLTKDTMFPQPVSRILSQEVSAIQLSLIFIAAGLLVIFVGALLSTVWAFFYFHYQGTLSSMPSSKIDWILHAVKEARAARELESGITRSSVSVASKVQDLRSFEDACVGMKEGRAKICVD